MGAAQNSINQAIGVGLGLAGTGAHLANQQESIKEQEESKKLQGINAAVITQGQLNETNAELQKSMEDLGQNKKDIKKATGDFVKQSDYKASGKHPNGLYSDKQLEAAQTALTSALKDKQALVEQQKRIRAQREGLQKKAEQINKIYGESIVEVKP